MHLGPTFALAVRRLLHRPVRSFLLLQGTVWGVAVAIFPSAVIQGTREAGLTRGATIGSDRIAIAPDPTASSPVPLRRDDVVAVKGALARAGIDVVAAAGVEILALPKRGVGADDPKRPAALLAAEPEALVARGLEVESGRPLRPGDAANDCVVEAGVAAWLGVERLAPGDRFRLPGIDGELRVVGVAAPRSAQALRTSDIGYDLEHPMYEKFAKRLLFSVGLPVVADEWKRSDRCVWTLPRGQEIDWIFLRVPPTEVSAAAKIASQAASARGTAVVRLYAFTYPILLGKEVDRFGAVNAALFLACLAMGAVVMANLGLLTVLRRTREIAIRRVEGATRRDVSWQFLFEGLLLSGFGAALGVGLGLLLAQLRVALEPVMGFTWAFPTREASWAVGIALAIGLAASALPARRAAALDPAEGLVDE
jgi:hypothetical protein